MHVFRQPRYKHFFVAFWCVIILNMNFYLVEIKILSNGNKALIETAKKLLSTVAEEEDSHETHGKGHSSLQKDLLFQSRSHNISAIVNDGMAGRLYCELAAGLHRGFYETFSPPPEA
jgi:hypothetical protein